MQLDDKVALVTGAASGIGREIAATFFREGARVAIADLNSEAAEATARALDPNGKRAIGVTMDVTDEKQVEAGTARVIDACAVSTFWSAMPESRSWRRSWNSISPNGN